MRHLISILTCTILLVWVAYLSWPVTAEMPSARQQVREAKPTITPKSLPHNIEYPVNECVKDSTV